MKSILLTFVVLVCAITANAIDLSFSFTAPSCNGFTNGTATVTPTNGVAPYAYAWSNGQSGQTVLGIGVGTFTVTVTDQNGATATGSVTVTEPAPIQISFSQSGPNCNNNFQEVTVQATGGTGAYSYAWSTGSTAASIAPTAPGNVFVTVTDGAACAAVATYYVPVPSQIFTSYATSAPACAGQSNGSITPNIVGNYPAFSWTWSTGTFANVPLSGIPSGDYSVTITDQQGCARVDQIFVPTQAPLQVMAQMTNVICHGTASGVGTALGAGGVSPYTYTWSTGASDQIIQNLSAGNYTVTLTDGNGCTASATGTVQQPDPLLTTVVSITPACGNSGGATVQPSGGTPPYNIVWNGGLYTGTTVSGVPAGTYYVCTFDANNCQLDIIVEIPGGPGLDVQLVAQKASCVGVNDGIATAIVAGGSGSYSYQWSTGPTNIAQINGLAAGQTVSVTVTDLVTGCTGSDTILIQTHTVILVQVVDVDVFCAADSTGSATANAFGGTAPYQYAWQVYGDTLLSQTINGLVAGAYPVTVTDAQGCSAISVANISATSTPNAQFAVETVLCVGDSVTIRVIDQSTGGGSAITSWNWAVSWGSGSVGFNVANPPLITIPANSNGFIQLNITTASGCTDVTTGTFETGKQPIVSIQANNPAVNCEGGPVPITVIGDSTYTYQWLPTAGLTFVNNDPRQVLAQPGATTTYTLIASDLGCRDTLEVEVIKAIPFEVTVNSPSFESCEPLETLAAVLNANVPNVTYVWYNAAGDSIGTGINITVPVTNVVTDYSVIATDAFGCADTALTNVLGIGVDVEAALFAQDTICENTPLQAEVINLDSTDTLIYLWTVVPNTAVISDPVASNPTITGPAGVYVVSVVVTNQFGCSRTLQDTIEFTEDGTLTGFITHNACNGLSVQFNNSSNVTGVWNFGDGNTSNLANPTHTYAAPGNYIVTFMADNACYEPFTLPVQVFADPSVVAGINANLANCLGAASFDFTDATQHVTQIANWQWTFTPGPLTSNQQNPTITFTQSGPITAVLVVTDVNNCVDTSDVVTLQADIVNDSIPGVGNLCPGGSVELNPGGGFPGYTYNWTATPPDPGLNAGSPNPTVGPAQNTNYAVTIVNGVCTVVQQVAITINEPALVNASNDTVVCNMAPVTISASSPNANSFEWSKSITFNEIFAVGAVVSVLPSNTGMNYVRARTLQGCPGIDSVMVMSGLPDIAAADSSVYICNGVNAALVVLNNKPGDVLTYSWSNNLPGIANPNVSPTVPTTYTVVVTNQFNCKDTLSFTAVPQNLALGITVDGDTTLVKGESTILQASASGGTGYIYNWTPANSLDDPSSQTPTATPDTTTLYTVTALDIESGCTIEDTVTIRVITGNICEEPFVFVPAAFTPNEDGNNDFFRVRGAALTEVYLVVYSRWGEKMYETNEVEHTGWDGIYKGVACTPDAYAWYAKVRCGDGNFWEKKGNVTLLR